MEKNRYMHLTNVRIVLVSKTVHSGGFELAEMN